jgi:hypothetical protein
MLLSTPLTIGEIKSNHSFNFDMYLLINQFKTSFAKNQFFLTYLRIVGLIISSQPKFLTTILICSQDISIYFHLNFSTTSLSAFNASCANSIILSKENSFALISQVSTPLFEEFSVS